MDTLRYCGVWVWKEVVLECTITRLMTTIAKQLDAKLSLSVQVIMHARGHICDKAATSAEGCLTLFDCYKVDKFMIAQK